MNIDIFLGFAGKVMSLVILEEQTCILIGQERSLDNSISLIANVNLYCDWYRHLYIPAESSDITLTKLQSDCNIFLGDKIVLVFTRHLSLAKGRI